jgi:cytoskeleton protein RodZ
MPNDSDIAMTDQDSPPKGTARVGAELRGVRERLGWKLSDVADGLRIRLPYLEAIERGELSALPGAAYQTGFVRSYSQALGLDPEEILRRFRAEGMGTATKAELSFLAPVPDRAVPTGAIVLLGIVVLLAGYGLWYHHTERERRLAAAVQSVPAELAPLAVPKPAPVAVKPTGSITQVATPAPSTPAPAVQASPAATAVATAPATSATPAPKPAPVVAPPVSQPAPQAAPSATGQSITATADSWIEVQDPTGNILFSKVLHAGDSWPVPDIAGLTMTAGNAGATEIANNGKAGPPLGAQGTVIHNYVLTTPAPVASTPAVLPPANGKPAVPSTPATKN